MVRIKLSAYLLLIICCFHSFPGNSQEQKSIVYLSGESAYSHFRIPSLISIENRLFAFAEARKHSASDHGQIDIVLKQSDDGGISWGELIIVAQSEGQSAQNPTPFYVSDQNKIILLFTKRTDGADTESMIRAGTSAGYMAVFQTESLDFGVSWSDPIEITDQVKKDDWNWYALGPGGALTLKNHPTKSGRIVVPANHSLGNNNQNNALGAHVIYSDDGGHSWFIGASDSKGEGLINPNETALAELSDGRLYLNTRNHSSEDTVAHRAFTISTDGGESFTHLFRHEPSLLTPIVHCSMATTQSSLYFIGPNDRNDRNNLGLWKNDMDLSNWVFVKRLHEGFSAYSSAVSLSDNQLGILFETEEYGKIIYQSVLLDH